jgi:hypothetical protein
VDYGVNVLMAPFISVAPREEFVGYFKHSDKIIMAKCAFRRFGLRDLSHNNNITVHQVEYDNERVCG